MPYANARAPSARWPQRRPGRYGRAPARHRPRGCGPAAVARSPAAAGRGRASGSPGRQGPAWPAARPRASAAVAVASGARRSQAWAHSGRSGQTPPTLRYSRRTAATSSAEPRRVAGERQQGGVEDGVADLPAGERAAQRDVLEHARRRPRASAGRCRCQIAQRSATSGARKSITTSIRRWKAVSIRSAALVVTIRIPSNDSSRCSR